MIKIKAKPQIKSQPSKQELKGWMAEWDQLDWLGEHGQLAVDVYQNDKEIIIKSAVAGVRPADLQISINNDVLTLRGRRHQEEKIEKDSYLFQECYWGDFSRTVVLPSEVDRSIVKAVMKNGILTIILPKKEKSDGAIVVKEVEEA